MNINKAPGKKNLKNIAKFIFIFIFKKVVHYIILLSTTLGVASFSFSQGRHGLQIFSLYYSEK